MIGFERKRSIESYMNTSLVGLQGELDEKQQARLTRIKNAWNFYEGYQWEEIEDQDSAEVTVNYCRAFVDKFVSFELGKSFSFSVHNSVASGITVTPDKRTLFEYLEDVWEDNKQYELGIELGQMKSVTGEAWVQVRYYTPEELSDPFGEYPEGRIRLMVMPTSVVFPEFNPHDKDELVKLTIMYMYDSITITPVLKKTRKERKLFKQIWTKDECITDDGIKEPITVPNKYGVIPFVQIKNLPIAGRTEGRGDLDDIIPLNTEYNLKQSNVSEILDYHAAPITIIYGAKIGHLEKGANKVWGGLPKDAKVENLGLQGDLSSSNTYISELKQSMCEVSGIPESVLGGSQSISNTSGVALQYMNLPLIEKTRIKKAHTETGLETLNKLIILVSIFEGLVIKPNNIPLRDFLHTEVSLPDTLPKDTLLELQQYQVEMKMGVESRRNIMKKLGKENIEDIIQEIDKDAEDHPDWYGVTPLSEEAPNINSGMTNGQTAVEQVRLETTGKNGGAE